MAMNQPPNPESEETKDDLRQVLMKFWLYTMEESPDAEYPERMKASEFLAKYFLQEGRTSVTRKSAVRPSTNDIMSQVNALERGYVPPPPVPLPDEADDE